MEDSVHRPRRETVDEAAKRRYPHMAVGMGKALLLFKEPHKQWDELLQHEKTPSRQMFASVGHEAIKLLKSQEIGMPLPNIGRYGPGHANALGVYWLTHGQRGNALKDRLRVLRYWARWVGYPQAAPMLEDLLRAIRGATDHG